MFIQIIKLLKLSFHMVRDFFYKKCKLFLMFLSQNFISHKVYSFFSLCTMISLSVRSSCGPSTVVPSLEAHNFNYLG